ncbi:MAG: NAD(P)H-dependent oxidoreductase [Clostridia bacterium]|nr:NAD(P)H-dependent oxidoreductase [Clostridia bacterium]
MKIIIHDLPAETAALLDTGDAQVVCADGHYAQCVGCFACWTKTPTECGFKDRLHKISQEVGRAEDMVVITKNCYGMFSPAVKNVFDRGISATTPLTFFRSGETHNLLRYGKKGSMIVYAYGDMTEAEEATMRLLIERNAVNYAYAHWELHRVASLEEMEGMRV